MVEIDYFKGVDTAFTVTAGETIFQVGDPDNVVYGVVEGEVDLRFNGLHLETVTQGGVFGEKSLIDDYPHTTTAIAKTDCTLVKLDEAKFLFLVHETPTFALFVMRTMTRRTRELMNMAVQ